MQAATGSGGRKTKKNYLNKELIYDDETACCISGEIQNLRFIIWRVFDQKSRKPYVKSLGTTDHARALVKARTIYQEIKGKIVRGERLRSITTPELIDMYLSTLHITDIPHEGVTPDTLKLKKYFMNTWLEFITSINHKNTPIDQLPSDKLIQFGSWFRDLPRRDGRTGRDLLSRSIMQSARSNWPITRWR